VLSINEVSEGVVLPAKTSFLTGTVFDPEGVYQVLLGIINSDGNYLNVETGEVLEDEFDWMIADIDGENWFCELPAVEYLTGGEYVLEILVKDNYGVENEFRINFSIEEDNDAGDYKVLESRNAPPDKIWTVTFNSEVDPATVMGENIYVKDARGAVVDTTLERINNNKAVLVYPPGGGYPAGDYTLYIEPGLRSVKGVPLKQPVKMQFTVGL